jgi:dethiobiotin synthetase
VDIEKIVASYRSLAAAADVAVVEGVGGWRVPLNDEETVCELAVSLQIPVVLVVGLRLGCINHALLTADAISAAGAGFLGWIANHSDPSYDRLEPTLETLSTGIGAPLLDLVPWLHGASVDRVCAHLENTAARILNA